MTEKPKPTSEWLPLERLMFDPRLQQRALPPGKVFDEETVARYVTAHEEGAKFPPLDVVNDGTRYWVLAGFNRGEMYARRGQGSVPCVVYPGTFRDALLWSLSENSRHGLPRKPEDCRRAFTTLISNPDILKQVLDGSPDTKEELGIQRRIAKACGIAKGIVGPYLADVGLRADRKTGKLVPIDEPKTTSPPPPANHRQQSPTYPRSATNGHTPTANGRRRVHADGPADPGEALDVINPTGPRPDLTVVSPDDDEAFAAVERLQKTAALLQRQLQAALCGPLGPHLIRNGARHNAHISKLEAIGAVPIGEGPRLETVWNWSPLWTIQAVLADTAAGLTADLYDRRAVV